MDLINIFKKLVLILVLFFGCILVFFFSKSKIQSEDMINPYFFNLNTSSVEYNAYIYPLSFNEIYNKLTLNINLLKKFEQGSLFTLELSQLNVEDPMDEISMGRRYLGYFYVTKENIYCMSVKEFNGYTQEQNNFVINLIEKSFDEFKEKSFLVCSNNNTENIADENGYHRYITINGDEISYYFYNDNVYSSKLYQKIVWKKNEGMVYYKYGQGSMFMHVEFGHELENKKNNLVNPN